MTEQNQTQPLKKRSRQLIYSLGVGLAIILCSLVLLRSIIVISAVIRINTYKAQSQQCQSIATQTSATTLPESDIAVNFAIGPAELSRRIITRRGQMSLIVEDVQVMAGEIEKIIEKFSYEGSSISRNDHHYGKSTNIVIRVPAKEFDNVMAYLAGMAIKVTQRGEVAENHITQSLYLDTRLKSLESVRDRLQTLSKHSSNLEEVLYIESLIAQRNAEIETLKGNFRFLSGSTQLGEISLTIDSNSDDNSSNLPEVIHSNNPSLVFSNFPALINQEIGSERNQNSNLNPGWQRFIITKGKMIFSVNDTNFAINEIQKIVTNWGDESLICDRTDTQYGDDLISDLKICIPAKNFNETMNLLAGFAVEIDSRTETAEDFTAEYFLLESRLSALEMSRDRLIELLNRPSVVDQALRIEQQIAQQDKNIVSIKEKMKLLSESAHISEITLSIYPYHTYDYESSPLEEMMANAFNWLFIGDLTYMDLFLSITTLLLLSLLIGSARSRLKSFIGKIRKMH